MRFRYRLRWLAYGARCGVLAVAGVFARAAGDMRVYPCIRHKKSALRACGELWQDMGKEVRQERLIILSVIGRSISSD